MSHCFYHAVSSARKFGGKPDDYQPLHNWFDESKQHIAGPQHRALRHHTEGIFALEKEFGITITNSEGKQVPVRLIGEQHVLEDLGRIPTVADWFREIPVKPWMIKGNRLSRQLISSSLEEPDTLRSPS